jgi:hypothetical protein
MLKYASYILIGVGFVLFWLGYDYGLYILIFGLVIFCAILFSGWLKKREPRKYMKKKED